MRVSGDYFAPMHTLELTPVMARSRQSALRSARGWLARAAVITCLLAQLFGSALSAATPCASMAMSSAADEMGMHDDHAPADTQAMNGGDCCDGGGVCSIAECATPVGACSTYPFVLQTMLVPRVFPLSLQHVSAESRRLFRPPIAA